MKNIPRCEECNSRLCSIFSDLSTESVQRIDSCKGGNFYRRKQTIFFSGTRPNGIYCISSGKAKIYKIDADGNEQIIRLAKEGDVLGYRSLICGEQYSSFAAALEDAVICFIPRESFLGLLEQYPAMSAKLMQQLAHDLKITEDRLAKIACKPVRERVAEAILILAKFYDNDKDGTAITLTLTREELANFIGTATESVIRFLSEFKKANLIRVKGREIKILDRDALIRTANIVD